MTTPTRRIVPAECTWKHPMQPLAKDDYGVLRFKRNAIIDYLFMSGNLNLNKLAVMDFTPEDRQQIAQLLGYSLYGYGDLSYVDDAAYEAAEAAASPASGKVTEADLNALAAAIKKASSERRYGKYDYSEYPGKEPPFVVRDERTGDAVFRSWSCDEVEREYARLCDEHIARTAVSALGLEVE